MKHSTSRPTKVQRIRLDAIHAMPCIACEIEKCEQPLQTEAHHLTDKGYRTHSGGHDATLPLEAWHHRGICLNYMTSSEMKRLYGPSLALHKREFVNVYGDERKLLAIINERLSKMDAA